MEIKLEKTVSKKQRIAYKDQVMRNLEILYKFVKDKVPDKYFRGNIKNDGCGC